LTFELVLSLSLHLLLLLGILLLRDGLEAFSSQLAKNLNSRIHLYFRLIAIKFSKPAAQQAG
jgi:hypothetical protein